MNTKQIFQKKLVVKNIFTNLELKTLRVGVAQQPIEQSFHSVDLAQIFNDLLLQFRSGNGNLTDQFRVGCRQGFPRRRNISSSFRPWCLPPRKTGPYQTIIKFGSAHKMFLKSHYTCGLHRCIRILAESRGPRRQSYNDRAGRVRKRGNSIYFWSDLRSTHNLQRCCR